MKVSSVIILIGIPQFSNIVFDLNILNTVKVHSLSSECSLFFGLCTNLMRIEFGICCIMKDFRIWHGG